MPMPNAALLDRPAPAGPAVPWWAQSMAERLMERIGSADVVLRDAITKVVEPHIQRARRQPQAPIRKERMIDLVRDWRSGLPADSRLGLAIDYNRNRRGVLISDCRVMSHGYALTGWEQRMQPGLAIALVRLRLAPHDIGIDNEFLVLISKHALGRRYQRGGGDDTDVLDDFRRLSIRQEALVAQGTFTCEVPRGRWAGDVLDHNGRLTGGPILQVRTFWE